MSVVVQLITPPSVALTGTLTFGSAAVTGLSSTASLAVGQFVQGTGVPDQTLIASIDSTSQVTLTSTAQANGSTSLTFLVEPVTLAQAKSQLRVDITDDDVLIAKKIATARGMCEAFVKRSFLNTVWQAQWDSFPFGGGYYNRSLRQFYGAFPGAMGATFPGFLPTNTGIIESPWAELRSVQSITYYDSSGNFITLDPSVYNVEQGAPGRIAPAYGMIWPTTQPRVGCVTIQFTAGYGASPSNVPAEAKEAILLLTTYLYENRGDADVALPDAVQRVLSRADWGGYS